jgi:hypothetical protein
MDGFWLQVPPPFGVESRRITPFYGVERARLVVKATPVKELPAGKKLAKIPEYSVMKTFKSAAGFVIVIIGNLLFSIMPQSY